MKQCLVLASLIAALLNVGCAATCTRSPRITTPEFTTTRCGASYHWRESDFPIRIRLNPNMPTEYVEGVEESRLLWNALVGFEFLVEDAEPVSRTSDGNEPGTIYFRVEELTDHGDIRTYGEATTVVRTDSSGEIHHSVIELDEDLPLHVLVSVVTHEIGHALGLTHDLMDPRSIMFPAIWEPTIQRVAREDVEGVRTQIGESALPVVAVRMPGYYAPWVLLSRVSKRDRVTDED